MEPGLTTGLGAFGATFGLIFVAELGDKTQLAVMALSARHSWRAVLAGAAAAFVVLNIMAVAAGTLANNFFDPFWTQTGAGLLFIVFGILALRGGTEESDEERKGLTNSIFFTSFAMIFLAELGDKTQLATAAMAARYEAALMVFVGSTLALWTVSAIGALLGKKVLGRLPARTVGLVAGSLFILFGLMALYSAWAIT